MGASAGPFLTGGAKHPLGENKPRTHRELINSHPLHSPRIPTQAVFPRLSQGDRRQRSGSIQSGVTPSLAEEAREFVLVSSSINQKKLFISQKCASTTEKEARAEVQTVIVWISVLGM